MDELRRRRTRPHAVSGDNHLDPVRESVSFLVRDGAKSWRCTLCAQTLIFDNVVFAHCQNSEHMDKLRRHFRTREPTANAADTTDYRYAGRTSDRRKPSRSAEQSRELDRRPSREMESTSRRTYTDMGEYFSIQRKSLDDGFSQTHRSPSNEGAGFNLTRHSSFEDIPTAQRRSQADVTEQTSFEERASRRGVSNVPAWMRQQHETPKVSLDSAMSNEASSPTNAERVSAARRPSPEKSLSIDERSVYEWNRCASALGKNNKGDGGEVVEITAMPDKSTSTGTFACTQHERPATKVTFVPSQQLNIGLARQVEQRLQEWDPFWETLSIVGMGVTSKVQSTSPNTDLIKSAAVYNLPLPLNDPSNSRLRWGEKKEGMWRNGDVALILRMLPVDINTGQKKRADCHLWAKGTFLQMNWRKIRLEQRKQQSHNESEWKSQCQILDVTEHVQDLRQPNNIQFFCYDDQPYVFVFSLCQYRSVTELQTTLTTPSNDEAVTVLPREACFDKAMDFASQHMTVNLDSDHEDDHDDLGKFVYSLLCPISKTIMTTPVRGKNCKHFQVRFVLFL